MGGSGGRSPPKVEKFFRKFVEIGNVKLKNLITFQKIACICCADLNKIMIIIENTIRPGGSVGGRGLRVSSPGKR